ncbi:hypothetical protein BB341_26880 [Streptomyces clavuligerus]|nr:hypothetical protein BB341_26880 [Streptomyces clavuligerus]
MKLLLGAYVLDALTPEEDRVVAAHVQWCADCRAEYLELAELPMLLAAFGGAGPVIPPPLPPAARDDGPGPEDRGPGPFA